ncbi:5,6-dimethylbenzimidazole synthase [Dermatophilus congolensis]|uniref:5,6-dimethylbenzimidazole synthase n=1 Tax=Dermatophilus congolensis TaxID=1863 RepID=UPI001AAF9C75|nr:5,6-dimethylbenzimidazole synthase [Dermatophilus congolensis]MBO3144006.1 5,6-dimethylbenzimidazole synthase [Dermatophilus congolensis]MBO3152998.1 5,6-dimethylbenzimidazole synthase [Dermatophilus congolensis]MBO3159989.1 5,6-dimethylbenzimidazole synthase [Dermatophilus congolensis]MBO3164284.1 5,6-dimethylbenzimidazole synthase [Dermatophilus congolensis]MBO3177832.1 5,6-dimethylbenzimidazole synthase [Dermatophilus congolensis]
MTQPRNTPPQTSTTDHLWERPVPNIGDTSSAAQRAETLNGWAYPTSAQAALRDIITSRRDVRRFRPDPLPEDLIQYILESAHLGPSVGHSQPWRFIIVTDPSTRDHAALMAERAKIAQAQNMTTDRGSQLLDLKVEGIREAPIGIIVACDRRAPAPGVLGRATFPDADLWSCAAAMQNMWLTARAAGLGMGWVTLFQPDELAQLVDLPQNVEPLGWLCIGWPDELPPSPGLERRAWSKRLPLEPLIMRERWNGSTPAPTSHLHAPEQNAHVATYDEADLLLTAPGSLGKLDIAINKIITAGRINFTTATLVTACADHPVHDLGVTAFPNSITRVVAEAGIAGKAVGTTMAAANGFDSIIIDCGVGTSSDSSPLTAADHIHRPTGPRGDIMHTDALTPLDVDMLITAGRTRGNTLADQGLVLLGEVGLGNTTIAAALTAATIGIPAHKAVGLGTASDTAMLERKTHVVRAALERIGLPEGKKAPASITSAELLTHLGGGEFAYLYGLILGTAEKSGIVVLDGLATSIPALLATREEPGVAAYLVAGQASREFSHQAVLQELGLEALIDARFRAGEGVGAILGATMLLTGLTVRRDSARTA